MITPMEKALPTDPLITTDIRSYDSDNPCELGYSENAYMASAWCEGDQVVYEEMIAGYSPADHFVSAAQDMFPGHQDEISEFFDDGDGDDMFSEYLHQMEQYLDSIRSDVEVRLSNDPNSIFDQPAWSSTTSKDLDDSVTIYDLYVQIGDVHDRLNLGCGGDEAAIIQNILSTYEPDEWRVEVDY